MLTKIVTGVLASALLIAWTSAADAKTKRKPTSEDRPPQFVMFAFDGSLNNAFWDESLAFADTVKTNCAKGDSDCLMRYTYFVSPVYYLDSSKKSRYTLPGKLDKNGNKIHYSCIGWDGEEGLKGLPRRMDRTNRAFKAGHEIASHANSHCDASGTDSANTLYGHPWSQDNWEFEFDQFNDLLFNVYSINGVTPGEYSSKFPGGFAFGKDDIVGFRAPLLATTKGLWPTLKKNGFRYDTSRSAEPTYWPQKLKWGEGSGWNFPLGELKVSGSKRKTFSMDYNWLCAQTSCVDRKDLSAAEIAGLKKKMLDSYKYYFKVNYFGGRAPVNIGHHFSMWNGGAYWQAMKEFAKFVCSKPEVRCVTYTEYANWLDSLSPAQYEAYRGGNFTKLKDDGTIKDIATPVLADVRMDMGNNAYEAVISETDRAKAPAMGWKPQLRINFVPQESTKITKEELVNKVGLGNTVYVRASLVNRKGEELEWQSHRIDKLGTAEESISDVLENHALQGEPAEAHME